MIGYIVRRVGYDHSCGMALQECCVAGLLRRVPAQQAVPAHYPQVTGLRKCGLLRFRYSIFIGLTGVDPFLFREQIVEFSQFKTCEREVKVSLAQCIQAGTPDAVSTRSSSSSHPAFRASLLSARM